jgi:hypothetical protein
METERRCARLTADDKGATFDNKSSYYTPLILSDNYRLSLTAATPPRLKRVGHVGHVNTINERRQEVTNDICQIK